jgi:threonine-phosphate decarboxylase
MINSLSELDWLYVYPSETNFLLVRIASESLDSSKLSERLMADGIAIRDCSNFVGLNNTFFRIAVKNRPENQKLVEALQKIEKDLV